MSSRMPPQEVLDALRKVALLKALAKYEEITEAHEELTCDELMTLLRGHEHASL